MSEEDNRVYDDIINFKLADFHDSANQLAESITSINRIPESYFYVKLWPIVRNVMTGQPAQVGEWLNVAGNLFNELIVEDDDTQQEIFRVPAFNSKLEPMVLNRGEQGERDISPDDLIERQEMQRQSGNFREVMAIESAIAGMYPMGKRSLTVEDLTNLVFMWQRYEVPLEELFGDATADALEIVDIHLKEMQRLASDDLGIVDPSDDAEVEEVFKYEI